MPSLLALLIAAVLTFGCSAAIKPSPVVERAYKPTTNSGVVKALDAIVGRDS